MATAALTTAAVQGYLSRLGVPRRRAGPTLEALFRLHRAQVERIPYETLDFCLGRTCPVDPVTSVERILQGRGGYCFQLNGAFAALLATLGFDVTRHRGRVRGAPGRGTVGEDVNHLAVTVRCAGGTWLVDAGLGDALHEPLRLEAGTIQRQGPFAYHLERLESEAGWRFRHDPLGEFWGMDFEDAPTTWEAFVEPHRLLSTSPDSPFVRTPSVFRRDSGGVDKLIGAVLYRVDGRGRSWRALRTQTAWFDVLRDRYRLFLDDVGDVERRTLWQRAARARSQDRPAPTG